MNFYLGVSNHVNLSKLLILNFTFWRMVINKKNIRLIWMNIFIYLHIEKSGIAVSDVIEQKITEHKKYKSILCYTIIYTFKYLHPLILGSPWFLCSIQTSDLHRRRRRLSFASFLYISRWQITMKHFKMADHN